MQLCFLQKHVCPARKLDYILILVDVPRIRLARAAGVPVLMVARTGGASQSEYDAWRDPWEIPHAYYP